MIKFNSVLNTALVAIKGTCEEDLKKCIWSARVVRVSIEKIVS